MKRIITILLPLFLTALSATAQRPSAREEIRQNPDKSATVFYMYDHDIPASAAAPRGYKPVYISHYGRHGARNTSSSDDIELIKNVFDNARARGILTPKGQEFYERYSRIYPVIRGKGGDLTGLGALQHHKIAHNMFRNYSRVLRRGAGVDANSTTSPRAIISMANFCEQLKLDRPSLKLTQQASEGTMYYLNPFTLFNTDVQPTDEGYNNKKAWWQKGFKENYKRLLTPSSVFGPLFTDPGFVKSQYDPYKLEMKLFGIAESMQCNGELGGERLWDFFPEDEIFALFESINYRFYCSKGPDTLWQKGRQWAFVWTTMQDILDKAESDLKTGEYAARLRFGHDITVMSLFCLLDIDGFNKPVGDLTRISDAWRSYDFPMGLNVQFIFYRGRKGDILVRMLYNERDMALPIADCGTPYFYRWEDFKAYAEQRIDLCHRIIATTQAPPEK